MKTFLSSAVFVFGGVFASGHHHASHQSAYHHNHNSVPTPVPVDPKTVVVVSTVPVTTTAASPSSSTGPLNPAPVLPSNQSSQVIKAMAGKLEQEEAESVANTFYALLNSGHLETFDFSSQSKLTEGSYQNDNDCVNCNEERRYRDFDYQYKADGDKNKMCYAIQRSDEGYPARKFQDISKTGTRLTGFVDGAQTLTLQTDFPFFDRNLVNPTVQVYFDGFVALTVQTPTSFTGGNTLPNPAQGPYDIIAPYYTSQTETPESIVDPAVYYITDSEKTIIQWETNERTSGSCAIDSQASAVYQATIEASGLIYFTYKLATCEYPEWSTVQVGVKPLDTELQQGYKTSFFQSACQGGGYYAPCPGTSVTLKRVKCSSLMGQTGIVKPKSGKKYKKSYKYDYKKSDKKSYDAYDSKKQHYFDYFHKIGNEIFHFH